MYLDLLINPVFAGIYALLIGSFLSVCIYRIPFGRPKGLASLEMEEGEIEQSLKTSSEKINIFFPRRSFCTKCKEQLRWWHNIPLFSWLIQRGQCSFCKTKISVRYPLVEAMSLGFALLCYYSFDGWTAFIIYLFCCALIVISFIDIDYYIIPNVISFPGMAIGFALAVINQFFDVFTLPLAPDILTSLYGLAVGGGFLFLISELYYRIRKKVGLGFGDVKLMAMVGLFFGPQHVIQAIFMGSMAGSVLGIAIILLSKKGSQHPLPFGPYLALGTVLTIFTKQDLMSYLVL